MPILSQVGAVFAAIESTPGTEATIVTTDASAFIQAIDPQYNIDFNLIERNYARPSLSVTPHIVGRRLATLSFSTEVFGTGVAATTTTAITQAAATPVWATLFEGCAYSGAVVATPAGKVYTPLTSGLKTLTIYCFYDGQLHKLVGAMGTYTLTAEAGGIATINWEFSGVYVAPVAQATPTPPISAVTPPLVESCSLVIGATAASVFNFSNVTITAGNNVVARPDGNSAQGFESYYITGRNTTVSFNPEAVLEAAHPFFTDLASGANKALSFNIGSTAGNKVIVTVPQFQLSNIQYSDRDGIRVYDVEGRATSTAVAGNDEVSYKFL